MDLYFYNTEFRPEANGVYEDLDKYLASLQVSAIVRDYKYIQPELNTTIKIDMGSHQMYNKNVGNFLVAKDGTKSYYYFIMDYSWRGSSTLMLKLALDTLNTYWSDITFTKNTHITRRYKNRYRIKSDNTIATPVVDKTAESITTPPVELVSKKVVGDTDHWYLIYKTDYAEADNMNKNPISCYCLNEKSVRTKTSNVGNVELTSASLTGGNWYALTLAMNKGDTIEAHSGSNVYTYKVGSGTGEYDLVYYNKLTHDVSKVAIVGWKNGSIAQSSQSCEKIVLTECKDVYIQDTPLPTANSTYQDILTNISYNRKITYNAGKEFSSLISFKQWYNANKTDSTLVKIQELAYAPFTVTYQDDTLVIPSGWALAGNLLKLTTAEEFKNIIEYTTFPTPNSLHKSDINVDTAASPARETKLWNSTYRYHKYIYDSNAYIVRPEMSKSINETTPLTITYYFSRGMDNSSLFKFSADAKIDSDYGEYMPCNRTTEIPYYTNEYINYIRYGKAVDERNRNLNVFSSVAGAAGTGASLTASMAFGLSSLNKAGSIAGGVAGAIVGGTIGAITLAINLTSSIMKANDTINSKIDAYTHQSSQANTSTDLSIFKQYNGNKLLRLAYAPVSDIFDSIFNYFRLYGYSCDDYEYPTFNSRYWSDYMVCEPEFVNNHIWSEFKDDIVARMKMGFRVFHNHNNNYNLYLDKENWENSLVDWSKTNG